MATERDTPILRYHICTRLKQARFEAGYTTAKAFCEKHQLKHSTYTLHEAGTRCMSFAVIERYAALLHINSTWLLTGLGAKSTSKVRQVPLLAWEEVRAFLQGKKMDHRPKTTTDVDLSPSAFAVTLQNDAMEPRYPQSTILVVDCEAAPKHKELVLFFPSEGKAPLFRQLLYLEDEYYAKPFNPDYKAFRLTDALYIIGKVVLAKLPC